MYVVLDPIAAACSYIQSLYFSPFLLQAYLSFYAQSSFPIFSKTTHSGPGETELDFYKMLPALYSMFVYIYIFTGVVVNLTYQMFKQGCVFVCSTVIATRQPHVEPACLLSSASEVGHTPTVYQGHQNGFY